MEEGKTMNMYEEIKKFSLSQLNNAVKTESFEAAKKIVQGLEKVYLGMEMIDEYLPTPEKDI